MSKFGTAKRKNEKCKRKKHHNLQELQMQNTWKKEINIRCLSQNSWNITAKKQTNVPLKSSENPTLMHMFFKPRVASPPCVVVPAPRPWIDCIHDEESVDISLASRCLQWYFDIWCDDYVNISAIEFHHCHHVFVGFYLEYSLLSLFPTKMDMGCGWAQHVSQQF